MFIGKKQSELSDEKIGLAFKDTALEKRMLTFISSLAKSKKEELPIIDNANLAILIEGYRSVDR